MLTNLLRTNALNLLSTFGLLLLSFGLQAQLPNSGFEDWEVVDSIEQPLPWITNNIENYISVSKSEDAYEGMYALQLIANQPTFEGPWPGSAIFGMQVDDNTYPSRLAFWGKCLPYENTFEGLCQVTMVFYNQGAVVGQAQIQQEPDVLEYTEMEVVPDLSAGTAIDSFLVIFQGGSIITPLGQVGNAYFLVDNLSLEITTSLEDQEKEAIQLFPNPVSTILNLKEVEAFNRWQLYDNVGAVLKKGLIETNELLVDVGQFPTGVYFLKLLTSSGQQITKKIIIQ